jgi:hypothetical protein
MTGIIRLEDFLVFCFAAALPLAFIFSIRYFFRKLEAKEQAQTRRK